MKSVSTRFSLIAVFLSLIIAAFSSACRFGSDSGGASYSGTFPQYSGVYDLVSVSYSDVTSSSPKSKIAGQAPPKKLRITHRMEWAANYWRHRLLLAPENPGAGQATGSFAADLDSLTRSRPGCVDGAGPCQFSGTPFRPGKGSTDQTDTWCIFYGYDYMVYAYDGYMKPEPGLLKNIYWSHDVPPNNFNPNVFGSQSGDQGVLELTDPSSAKVDDKYVAQWNSEFNTTPNGMSITLMVSKLDNSAYSDCSQNGFPLSDSDHDPGSVTLVYRLKPGNEDYSTDLRSEGTSDVKDSSSPNLFEQITNFK